MNIDQSKKENPNNNKNNSNPKDIKFYKNLIEDSFAYSLVNDPFCVFKSINNNILYLMYSNHNKSIISYDIVNNKKITEIKNAHEIYVTNLMYYADKLNKRDLILSISCYNNNLKIWDLKNMECLINLVKINQNGFLFSACILNHNNLNYIVTSNANYKEIYENIKIFNFNGDKIKEINNSNEQTYSIASYYDNNLKKNYIITSNNGSAKSYDYDNNQLYFKYYDNDNNNNNRHFSLIINVGEDKIIKLIESGDDGNIRIWNFHTGIIIIKIKVCDNFINGVCLWDNKHLFVTCDYKSIKLIDIKRGIIIKNLIGQYDNTISIKKIFHPYYGECLISQGYNYIPIKLHIIQN